MTGKTKRLVMRWVHIIFGAILGTYIYSPWSSIDSFSILVKFIVIPVMAITGIVMWRQGKPRKVA